MKFEELVKKISDLKAFISYLESTKDEEWCVDIVRSKGNKQNCVMGHLTNWVYGKEYEGNIVGAWDLFEEIWATTYMTYPVNDGESPKYKQDTPKKRMIVYLQDLLDGKEKTTNQLMNEL